MIRWLTKTFLFVVIPMCVTFLSDGHPIRAQETIESARETSAMAIELYRQGDIKKAIKALRRVVKENKTDADAWYYLGAALNRNQNIKGAREAFKRAVELRPEHALSHVGFAYVSLLADKIEDALIEVRRALTLDSGNVEAHYVLGRIHMRNTAPELALNEAVTAINLDPTYAPAFVLKSQAILGIYNNESSIKLDNQPKIEPSMQDELKVRDLAQRQRFRDAAESFERYLELSSNDPGVEFWEEQLKSLRVYGKIPETDGAPPVVHFGFDVDTKAQLISKPGPFYPSQEAEARINGIATILLTLSSEGTITNVLVIQATTNGFAASATEAARKIKFHPAIKNGKPACQYIMVEYNFSSY